MTMIFLNSSCSRDGLMYPPGNYSNISRLRKRIIISKIDISGDRLVLGRVLPLLGGFFSDPQNPVDTHQHGSPFLLHLRLLPNWCASNSHWQSTTHNPYSLFKQDRISSPNQSIHVLFPLLIPLAFEHKKKTLILMDAGLQNLKNNSTKLRIPQIDYQSRLRSLVPSNDIRQILGCFNKICPPPKSDSQLEARLTWRTSGPQSRVGLF